MKYKSSISISIGLLFLLIAPNICFGNPNIDSVLLIASQKESALEEATYLFKTSKQYLNEHPKDVRILIDQCGKASQESSNLEAIQNNIYLNGIYFSRNHQVDSALFYFNQLIELIAQKKLVVEKSRIYLDLGSVLRRIGNFDSALYYYQKSSIEYEKKNDHFGISKTKNNTGIIFRKLGELDSAMSYYQAALQELNKSDLNDPSVMRSKAISLMNVGIVYTQFGANEKALEYFLKSLDIKLKLNNATEIARGYLNLGVLYSNSQNREKSLEYYKKALEISKKRNLVINYGQTLNNIGNYFAKSKMFDSALHYHKRALTSRLNYKNKRLISESYHNIGNLFFDLNNYDSSGYYLTNALNMRYEINDKNGIANSLITLTKLNLRTGITLGIEDSLIKALDITTQNGNIIEQKSAYNLLSEYYDQSNQYEKAFASINQFHVLKDSLDNRDKERKMFEQEKKFSLIQSEETIANNQAEIKNQRNLLWAFAAILLISIIAIVTGIYLYKIKNQSYIEIQEKNLKIETLMRELHHRVKNNLQVISSLLGLQSMRLDDSKAKEVVEESKNRVKAMSMIHQRLYKNKDIAEIDFDEYVKDLINDLKYSYMPEAAIKIDINIPETHFDVDTTLPLGLILNELICNSFKYAFDDINEPILKVELLRDDLHYTLKVSDNGIGLKEDLDIEKSTSFGLKLVNLLVKQLKGEINYSSNNGTNYQIQFAT